MSSLTDVPNRIPPRLGHLLARLLGLSAAYAYFCHHCPEPTLWDAPE